MLTMREKGLLLNIIKHCEKIILKISCVTKEKFEDNEDSIEIVCFNLLQIGELSKNFDPSFTARYPNVPWKQIKGMRDKVAHGYDTLDIDKVWETSKNDIPMLLDYCKFILKDN